MGDRLTSHKISKYIDYPNMKELFLSLRPRIGDSHWEMEMGHYLTSGCKSWLPVRKCHKPPQEKQQPTPFQQGI
jgi:hypothetical protein